jgi:SAM-dependent methyltransferase
MHPRYEGCRAAAALGLAERSSVLAGDFFASVPEADLYLLKHVLHDWDDGQSVRILENCRRAMRPGGRVIVIELLLELRWRAGTFWLRPA